MKKNIKKIASILLTLVLVFSFAGCGKKEEAKIVIAVPNDTSNEARALLLLEAEGLIEVDDKAGINATIADITSNPKNIEFYEVEAAQLPRSLADVDYAVINGNYAIDAGLKPSDALALEGSASPYANIVCVKEGHENDPLVKALIAAITSQQVKDYIADKYKDGSVVATIDNPTDGYDPSLDYAALAGQKITVAATPTPHCEILNDVVKGILEAKGIVLEAIEYNDYVQPNMVVESGEVTANFFQHVPYLTDFNTENGTHVVSVCLVHCEPMGLFGGKQTTLDALK